MTAAAAVPDAYDYLARLNPEQREAVEALDGPVLVLAGAGTGKTRVLTTRFAHLLLSGRAAPGQVLGVTFTNKAAREMRDRIAALIGRPIEGLWLGTFHALCARLLRRHAERVGLTPSFTILDSEDQLRLLKQVMEAEKADTKRCPPARLMAELQRWKDRGLAPDAVSAEDDQGLADGRARSLYAAYQARLKSLNAVDFGDLLLYTVELMRRDPEVLAELHRRFRWVMVDEYQDTNVVQYLWLRLLAQAHRNICCVGDDDQSIYSWRGAEIENILRFERDFPGAKVVRLERNYRSTAPILAAASTLITRNEGRLGKTLRAAASGAEVGDPVEVHALWDSEEEARMVVARIESLRAEGHALAEIAILVRAGFQTRAFEERLIVLGIPYRIVAGIRFYDRQEIRDALAYLRLLVQPADDLAFERIVNVPKRGLGEAALRAIHDRARADRVPLARAAAEVARSDLLKGRPRAALAQLLADLDRWRAMLSREGHAAAAAAMLDESGYTEMWRKDTAPDAPGRLENLRELVRALSEFETLEGFLEHVALVTENDEAAEGDRVNLMTLHAAKGLEFDTVFLPGWEEGVFPNQRALDDRGTLALEEERRLAYVGLTRARRRAVVSWAANRRIYDSWQPAIPSRFLDELPETHVCRAVTPLLAQRRFDPAASVFPAVAFGGAGRRRVVEAAAWEVAERAPSAERFAPGDRVFHDKFGYGTIHAVEEDRLEIEFATGVKRVLDRFVRRA